MPEVIRITDELSISESELDFTFSRSGGPGGQNVNKVNSRVTLFFDVENSPSLSGEQRARIRSRLSTRVSKAGVLRVVAQRQRRQADNQREAIQRFVELVQTALKKRPPRRKTQVSEAARRQRIEEKVRRGQLKEQRSKPSSTDD